MKIRLNALERLRNFLHGKPGHNECMSLVGELNVEVRDENGNIKQQYKKKNLITTAGFQLIADALGNSGSRPAVISYIAVGTNTTAAAIGDTALGTEAARVAASYSYAAKVITFTATFNPGTGTGALTEAGIFNASSAGTMLNHVVFSVINKGSLDTMTVTFTITLS